MGLPEGTADSNSKPAPWEALEFVTTPQPQQNDAEHIEEVISNELDAFGLIAQPVHSHSETQRLARLQSVVGNSASGVKAEHNLGILRALKLYHKAIGWSFLLSLTIVMEGYDLTIINNFYAFPQFKKAYGVERPNGDYQITTAWQSALTNGAVVGEIIGLLFNGYLTEWLGYRWTLVWALVALCGFIFLAVFAVSVEMLLASEILCGLSWGVFQTLSTTYAAEIMPVALRAYLTSNVNLCWLLGQITATGVLRGLIHIQSSWSYKLPFALQWVWAFPILMGVLFAPESPWWLVRHGRLEQAKKALLRLTTRGMKFDADESVDLMKKTNDIEKHLSSGMTYLDCFKGVNLRRTEIACMVWMIQTLSGSPMTGYATYFYTQAGFSPERSFDLSLGMYGMAIIGNIISWFLLPSIGRRTSYLLGTGFMFLTLMVAGIVSTRPDAAWVSWTLGSLVIALTFIYDTTIGPVCYSLVAEIPSTRLRVKTVVLARVAYNVVGIISNVLMPKMLNPAAWDWKGRSCFLWAGTCFFCFIWTWFRLPEPKGLTYLEIDLMFEKGINARKFSKVRHTLVATGYFDIAADQEEQRKNWRGAAG